METSVTVKCRGREVEVELPTDRPELVEKGARMAVEAILRSEKLDTCTHEEGVILHRGEEVCVGCWICAVRVRGKIRLNASHPRPKASSRYS